MSNSCKICGRNTDTVANPIEFEQYQFCSEPCYSRYLKSKGIKRKSTGHPIKKKKVMDQISELPTPLKVVTYLNIALAAISLVQTLAYIASVPLSTNIENGFSVLLSVLIIIGIIQASRLIRIIVLICSWIAVTMIGISIPVLFMNNGLQSLLALIPFSVNAITIWGLSTARSKAYFGY
jgi:hypothetical protein